MEVKAEQIESAEQDSGSAQKIEVNNRGRFVIHLQWQSCLKVTEIFLVTIASYFLPLPGLTEGSRVCLAIFVGAAGLLLLVTALLLINAFGGIA